MIALVLALAALAPVRASAQMPDRAIWVWHGAHDLRGLPADVGVAYLARTLVIDPVGGVHAVRRGAPLVLDDATVRWAVIHVELEPGAGSAAMAAAQDAIVAHAIAVAGEPRVSGVQIDLDAPRSTYASYAVLLRTIRHALPRTHALSITALGSWCLGPGWLGDADVDLVVPMMFGPGHDAPAMRARLASSAILPERRCRDAIGVREGDPLPPGRVFVFPRGRWTVPRAIETLRR